VIDRDANDTANALIKLGTSPVPLPPLVQRVDPRYRAKLAAVVAKTGLPAGMLDRMKTWAAGMVLFGVTVAGLGVSSADGVEEQLKAQFREAGKPIEGLETLNQQLGFFDGLDEAQQRKFLESVVADQGNDAADFGRMLGAWSRGNERAMQRSIASDMKGADVLQAVLLQRRNERWGDLLVKRLGMPGTQFIAVGAGHLVGPNSVQAQLAKLGYTVRRVE
jgi:uncharacterized protein YbaP (TraB family)